MWLDDFTHAALTLRDSIRSGLDHLAPAPDTVRQIHDAAASLGIALDDLMRAAWHDILLSIDASLPLVDALTRWLQHMTPETSSALSGVLSAWWATPAVKHVLGACAAVVALGVLLSRPSRPAAPVARSTAGRHAAGWRAATLGAGAGAATVAMAEAFWHHDDNLGDDADPSLHSDLFAASESLSESSMGCINPATGLPMIGDSCGGLDVMGNPYGSDLSDSLGSSWSDDGLGSSWNDDSFSSMNWSSDDSWSSSTSSWD